MSSRIDMESKQISRMVHGGGRWAIPIVLVMIGSIGTFDIVLAGSSGGGNTGGNPVFPPGSNPDPTLPNPPDFDPPDEYDPTEPFFGLDCGTGGGGGSLEGGGGSALSTDAPKGPKRPPCPFTPDIPCDCTTCPCPCADSDNSSPPPALSDNPVMLRDGSLVEQVVDFSLSGPNGTWAVSRNYRSQAYQGSSTSVATAFGNGWFSGDAEFFLYGDVSGTVHLVIGASSNRAFQWTGSGYASPPDSSLILTKETSPSQLVMTDEATGAVYVFYGLSSGDQEKRGRLRERTTRYRRALSLAGTRYGYDSYGRIDYVLLPQGQDYYVDYEYSGTSRKVSKIEVWTENPAVNPSADQLAEVEYTYLVNDRPWVGSAGDLIQVKVKRRDTSLSAWIERVTQYRYYGSDSAHPPGALKAIFEHDAIQRIIEQNGCTGTTPESILLLEDCDDVSGGGGDHVIDYASRLIDYYRYDEGDDSSGHHYLTLWGGSTEEDLEAAYGLENVDEVVEGGLVRSERIGGGCSSCGGGNPAIERRYHYLRLDQPGGHEHNYVVSTKYQNLATGADINAVTWIVVEDTAMLDSNHTPLYRRIYGLNDHWRKLREVVIENPQAGTANATGLKCWCQAWTFLDSSQVGSDPRKNIRLAEYRHPSAYTVDSNAKLRQFLNPYDSSQSGSARWNNDTAVFNPAGGVIEVYEYNSDGYRTGTLVKKGPSGTANYVSATQYTSQGAYSSLPSVMYTYPSQTTTSTNGIPVTFSYEFWNGDNTRIRKITTTFAKVPTSENGSGDGGSDPPIKTEKYFDKLGRLRWEKDGEGYVTYYSYNPSTGGLAYKAVDVDPTASTPPADSTAYPSKWVSWNDDGSGGSSYDSSGKPSTRGWNSETLPTALVLISKDEFDLLGRARLHTDEGGGEHYTAYQVTGSGCNRIERTITVPFWDGNQPLLPIEVTELNHTGKVAAAYSLRPDFSLATGITGLASVPSGNDFVTLMTHAYDPEHGQLWYTDRYHDIPSTLPGTISTHFDRTAVVFDAESRQIATIRSIEGTVETSMTVQVEHQERDVLGRPKEMRRWRDGSYDLSPDDLTQAWLDTLAASHPVLTATEYDGGSAGDGHVTRTDRRYGTGTNDLVKTNFHRTYRGHVRGIERLNGINPFGPYTVHDVDWQGRRIHSAQYAANQDWTSTGVLQNDGYVSYIPSSTSSFERTDTFYDKLGRTYRTERYPGTSTSKMQVNNYRDRNGRLVSTGDRYGSHREYAFDGAGRQYQSRTVTDVKSIAYSAGKFQYCYPVPTPDLNAMDDSPNDGNDGLIEFVHKAFDSAGNATERYVFEINHDDSNGIDISSTASFVRRSEFNWFDVADRITTRADYGSGNGTSTPTSWSYTLPSSRPPEPTWSDSPIYDGYVLLTKIAYHSTTGRQDKVTTGVRKNGSSTTTTTTKTFHDDLGRRVAVAENWVDYVYSSDTGAGGGTNNQQDRVTKWAYNGSGKVKTLTAVNVTSSGPVNEVTEYKYTDATDATLVTLTKYPDGNTDTSGSNQDNVQVTYNLDGTIASRKDQRGVVIDYTYDNARRLESEKATTIPSPVYGSGSETDAVKHVKRTYDLLGRMTHITSYNSTGTTTVLNEIQYAFYDYDRIEYIYQSHENAVQTSTTPKHRFVGYGTAVDGSGIYTDGLRPSFETYAVVGGATRSFGAANGISDRLNRVEQINVLAGGIGAPYGWDNLYYSYNGTDRLARVRSDKADTELKFYAGTGNYSGWDRFGRTLSQKWSRITGGATLDQTDYTYDYAGNRLTRNVRVDLINGAYPDSRDQKYDYDGLQRLLTSDQGTLSSGSITSSNQQRYWELDQLGNWSKLRNGLTGTSTVLEDRTHNAVNELTGFTTPATHVDPTYDLAGNMTEAPSPADPTAKHKYVYDAWNRLVKVTDAADATITTMEYDGRGQRIRKVVGSTAYDYYYNDQWQLVSQTNNGTAEAVYTWHPYYIDALALRQRPGELTFFCQDANFNVTAAIDAWATSGTYRQVVERYSYSPYGEVTFLEPDFDVASPQSSAIGNQHLYTGRERDPETGLQLNRERFYIPPLGRWNRRDPIGYEGSKWNLYRYGDSAPTHVLDPNGTDAEALLYVSCPWNNDPCKKYRGENDYAWWQCLVPCGIAGCTPDDAADASIIGTGEADEEGFDFLEPEHSALRHCITVGVLARKCNSCSCPICANDNRDKWQTMCGKQGPGAYRRAVDSGEEGAECAGCRGNGSTTNPPDFGDAPGFNSDEYIINCCKRKLRDDELDLGR